MTYIERVILIGLVVFGFMIGFKNYSYSETENIHPITTGDQIVNAIVSVRNQSKLVVSDANIRTEYTSRKDSQIWDARVNSSATARVQVYLSLDELKSDWVKLSGSDVVITIPPSAIKAEIINPIELHTPNGSWDFYFSPQSQIALQEYNHRHLVEQLIKERDNLKELNTDLVRDQFLKIFTIALKSTDYHVSVVIDNTL